MLPIFKKNVGGGSSLTVKTRPSDQPAEQQHPGIEAAHRLIAAIHGKDAQGVVDALNDLNAPMADESLPDDGAAE